MINIGLLHHIKELARIGAQAFDIAPLPLGIDRIEGKAGFARAAEPRDHHKLVARDIHIDILEIMFTRAAHFDFLEFRHTAPCR